MSTFARWVSTPENRSALVAVQRVADGVCRWDTSPKRQHGDHTEQREANPLFLHGPAGTGKTHLVAALADRLIRQCPDVTCTLLPAAEFAERIRHSQEQESQDVTPDWHSDLLAVEDLQHLPVWAAEALIGVLDDRTGRRQQTVITATVGPGQLTRLPARLTSRLAAGLVVGLEPLSPSSRLALLQDKAARRQLALGPDVLAWLAEHAGGSGRQIEGALARVEALTRLNGRVPDVRTVTEHFAAEADLARPTVERIAERVSTYFQVAPREIVSRRRLRNALLPRQVGMYLARRLTPLSLEQIGTYFGGRDHSTVLHACRKVEEALVQDAALSGAVRRLQADLL
jgi:chromosomal replication initiator protein